MLRKALDWLRRSLRGPNIMQLARMSASSEGLKHPYSDNPWVYRAIRYKADNIARLPFSMVRGQRNNSDSWERLESHPFQAVLDRPNALQSGYELIQQTVTLMETAGAAFLVMPGRELTRYPTEILCSSPTHWKRVKDSAGATVAWEYRGSTSVQNFAPWEIVLLRYIDPEDPEGWLSPLTAARKGISSSFAAESWNEAFYKNSAVPRGALESERNLDDGSARRIMAEWNDTYGGASNNGKVALLEGGLKFRTFEVSHADMEWIKGQEWNRDLIMIVTGVWPEVFGFGSTTFNNRAEARRDVWESTLVPLTEWIESALWHQLFWSVERGQYWASFDLSGVQELQRENAQRIADAKALWQMGVPFQQVNTIYTLGVEEFEGWDVSYLPGGVVPTTELLMPPEDEPTEEDQQDALDWVRSLPPAAPEPVAIETAAAPQIEARAARRAKGDARYWTDRKQLERRARAKIKRHLFDIRARVLRALEKHDREAEIISRIAAEAEALFGEDRRAWQSEEDVTKALRREDVDRILREVFELADTQEDLSRLMRPIYRDAVRAGALQVVAEIGRTDKENEGTWKPSREQLAILRDRGNEITRIHETTRKRIMAALVKGVAEDENLTGLQGRIRDVFHASDARALMIARTEVGGAMEESRNNQMEREGVEFHEWVASGDEATRDTHDAEDGHRVKVGEEFPSTGLRFPCDPLGPAEEVINCRCRTVAVEKG